MTNVFLKVNKDLFKLGLNPTEILVLAQVIEFNTTTGDCFISDKALAEAFGVSDKTISRTISALEDKGFIVRDTRSAKGGKIRHITANINKIEEVLTTDKMSIENNTQQTKCPLTTDKLSFDNGQNDLIKENIKDNQKEKIKEKTPIPTKVGIGNNEPIEENLPEITMAQALSYWDEFDIEGDILISPDRRKFKFKGEKTL